MFRKTVAASALALVFATPALAAQALLPAQSEMAFVSTQMGVPVQGHFTRFSGDVAFDPARPAAASTTLFIDMGSATLGVKETDAELAKADWFDVAKFPQATFTSSAVKALGGGRFEVAGQLSIKGKSLPVTVPVTLVQQGAVTVASGEITIKRLAFGIGGGEWGDASLVADDVKVSFRLALSGVDKI